MKASRKSHLLLAGAALCAASLTALAAPPPGKGPKRELADFVRGQENTKAPRVELPRNEAEAVAERRMTAAGIVEMQLPEDRMVNLEKITRADGTVTYAHRADDAQDATAHDDDCAAKGEVE